MTTQVDAPPVHVMVLEQLLVGVRKPKPRFLSSNDRAANKGTRIARSKLTAEYRKAAKDAAAAQGIPRGLRRAHVLVTVHFKDRRQRDTGNLQPTAKAIVDGLVDHGLLADDNDTFLEGPDMRRGEELSGRPHAVLVITITELTDEDPV